MENTNIRASVSVRQKNFLKCTNQLIGELYDAEFTLTSSFAFQIRDKADVNQNKLQTKKPPWLTMLHFRLIQRRYFNLAV